MATSQKFILGTDERGSLTEELPFVNANQSYSRFLTANIQVNLAVPSWAKKFKLTVSSGGFVYVGQGTGTLALPQKTDNSWVIQACEANPILRGLIGNDGMPAQSLRFVSPADTEINVIFYEDDRRAS